MYIKRYTAVAMIFIILVGWYVYAFITQDSISIDFFGVTLPSLPIAFLVVFPLVLLYVATLLHISFYSLVGSFRLRKYEKDYEKFLDAMMDIYLGKEDKHTAFKTSKYQLLGSLVDNTTFFANQDLEANTSNEKINGIIKVIEDIKNLNVVDLKKYSLPSSNALVIQNERNRYKKGDISAEDILSNSNKYDASLSSEVYVDFVKTAPFYAIDKYKAFLTKEALFEILHRVNAETFTLEISNEDLMKLFNKLDLTTKDYITASSILSTGMIPEQRMKLFETLSEDKDNAMDAYLFTLFDLEMLAPADEILENSQQAEYLNFKSYRALKECNKHFNINLFI
jgi:hypothetical protein